MITNDIITHLLDILPFLALILLAAAFLWKRHRCRAEEKTLEETIQAFRREEAANKVSEVLNETENEKDY